MIYDPRDMAQPQRNSTHRFLGLFCLAGILVAKGIAQLATPPQTDSSFIDEHGTAHVTRVVPVPKTISPEAQAMLARPVSDAAKPQTLEQRRTGTDKWQLGAG